MHRNLLEAATMDWDNLRYFLEVARAGRLTTAARRLAVDHTTVSRRLQALEKHRPAAIPARAGWLQAHRSRAQPVAAGRGHGKCQRGHRTFTAQHGRWPSGQVRIGATEGYGTVMLAGQLTGLSRRYPHLNIDLLALPRAVRLSRHEADIVITSNARSAGRSSSPG